MSVFGRAVVGMMPLVPDALVKRFARPYIAGETLDDAVAVTRTLMSEGCAATIDVLGEEAKNADEATALRRSYLDVLDAIGSGRLDAHLSVKLSGFGLRLDPALGEANLRAVVERAGELGTFVRIDMEDSSMTDVTLALYRKLRASHDNLGVVLQARLRRTPQDAAALASLGVNARVVKGIYAEPEAIAFQDREEIRDSYVTVAETILTGGGYAALATHDTYLVQRSVELVGRLGLERQQYEFQLLLGVRPQLRRQLVEAGHRVRVYVPFGQAWLAYSLRRLRENPAVASHIVRNVLHAPGSPALSRVEPAVPGDEV
jgi:proline dehydrogenase